MCVACWSARAILISTGTLLALCNEISAEKGSTIFLHWSILALSSPNCVVCFCPQRCCKCATILSNNKSVKINICAQTICAEHETGNFFILHVLFWSMQTLFGKEWNGMELYLISIIIIRLFFFSRNFLCASFLEQKKRKKNWKANVRYREKKRSSTFLFVDLAKEIVSISANANEFICFLFYNGTNEFTIQN